MRFVYGVDGIVYGCNHIHFVCACITFLNGIYAFAFDSIWFGVCIYLYIYIYINIMCHIIHDITIWNLRVWCSCHWRISSRIHYGPSIHMWEYWITTECWLQLPHTKPIVIQCYTYFIACMRISDARLVLLLLLLLLLLPMSLMLSLYFAIRCAMCRFFPHSQL